MNASEARARVLAVYPDAYAAVLAGIGTWMIRRGSVAAFIPLLDERSNSEDAAWIDAASRLPASEEKEPIPKDVPEMTEAELDEELRANGIDPHELNKKMLDRIRAEKAAGKSGPLLDAAEIAFEEAVKEKEPSPK